MSLRIAKHIFFWMAFLGLYIGAKLLFAAPSDMAYPPVQRTLRYFLSELAFLPWKIIPFYFLFYYLIPQFIEKEEYIKMGVLFVVSIIICLFGYRSMVAPVSFAMYGETPEFNVYSLKRFIYSMTDIVPAIGLASTIKLLSGRMVFQKKNKALQKEKQIAELRFLKAQTNPHFLFNTLNNLYGLARKNDPNTAPSIMKLSNLMRYVLQEGSESRITIGNEIKIIEDYIALEKLRYGDRLTLSFQKNLDNHLAKIAPLILLPFVENAFKHGTSESRFNSFINIHLSLSGSELRFNVENSYDQSEDRFEGIGLRNVKRQLQLIYGHHYSLEITPSSSSYSIKLLIHLTKDEG